MSSLAGTADLRVVDGAVTGWDVGQIINGLGIGRLPSPTPDPAARTPFTQLSASFGITEGIATTLTVVTEESAIPDSIVVGISGATPERRSPSVAMMRILPA